MPSKSKKELVQVHLPYEILNFHRLRTFSEFKGNSRNSDKRSMEALRFMFTKFKVPSWLVQYIYNMYCFCPPHTNWRGDIEYKPSIGKSTSTEFQLCMELLVAFGQGISAKTVIKPFLSKTEFSFFIKQNKFPAEDLSFLAFLIFCKARSKGFDHKSSIALARKHENMFDIFRKKERKPSDPEVLQFIFDQFQDFITFCQREKPSINAMTDILDFLFQQPEFSFKGRTLQSVMNKMNEWHDELIRKEMERKLQRDKELYKEYEKSSIDDWEYIDSTGNIWTVMQLMNYKELVTEGRKMHNCVASYHNRCANNSCQIFSIRENGQHVATLELRGKSCVQARGVCNSSLKPAVTKVFSKWCNASKVRNRGY